MNTLEIRDHRVDSGLNYQKAMKGDPNKDVDSTFAEIYFRKNLLILAKLAAEMDAEQTDLSVLMPNEAVFASFLRIGSI